jgi:hypothetical protein
VPKFRLALWTSHNYYYIKSEGQMFEFVRLDEKFCRSGHSDLLCFCDCRFGINKIFVGSCFNLHKNNYSFWDGHNQVEFACSAGKVPFKQFITFVFKELFTELLASSAEQARIFEQFFLLIVPGTQFYAPVVCSVRFCESLTPLPVRSLR